MKLRSIFKFLQFFCLLCLIQFSFAAPDIIYVYSDLGAAPIGLQSLKDGLGKLITKKYKIKEIRAADIVAGRWKKDAILLIMPGGASSYYCKYLNGEGNKQIQEYVSNGGAFLGICAGAYFATKHVEFAKDEAYSTVCERELALFKGKIEGPSFLPFSYGSHFGTRAVPQVLSDGFTFRVYYKGGGHFHDVERIEGAQILGNYEDGRVSIIKVPYGKGVVILSNVHFEMDYKMFPNDNKYLMAVAPELEENDDKRMIVFARMLNYLGIETQNLVN